MRQTEIDNIKSFTGALFAGTTFDSFCVTEASFSTLVNITIDGHVNKAFLKDEDGDMQSQSREGFEEVATWQQIRQLCYEAVKGSRKPLRFKIVFMTPPEKVSGFVKRHGLTIKPEDISGLFMNIRFEEGKLTCTSGTSVKTFSLDKSLEIAWDESVAGFIKKFV